MRVKLTRNEGNIDYNVTSKEGIVGSDLVIKKVTLNNLPCALALHIITAFPD